jgi:hypothetical protein
MLNFPIQSAPIHRTRVTRGSMASSSAGISPSITAFGIPIGPFADDAVSPSLSFGPISIGPFAGDDAE